jgi:CBS domain-containing protein
MPKTLAEIASTPIGDIARRPPVRVSPDTPLSDVVRELRERNRGAVIVEDAAGIVGIFSERDVMARVDHASPTWQSMPVSEVMTRSPRTIRVDARIEESINLMVTGDYRHLPLVDESNKVVGIVSIRDILAHIVSFFPGDFLNLPPDPEREARSLWGG